MNALIKLWQKIAPLQVLMFIRFLMEPKAYKVRRKEVLKYFKDSFQKQPPEIQEALRFFKCHKYTPFPYYWALKYENLVTQIFYDDVHGRFYVKYQGKNLYYPKNFTKIQALWATRSILKEQDPKSPHLYLTENFQVEDGSIVIDAGVAEGNFALSIVEKVKKLYLIECEPEWVNTLKITFEPWKDKVVFIEKYLSDNNDEQSITIDSILKPDANEKYFIKMDIEGFEKKALAGMETLLKSPGSLKLDVCTYHHPDDLTDIGSIMNKYKMKWHVSDGFVLFYHPGEDPSFRKVLIRAEKE